MAGFAARLVIFDLDGTLVDSVPDLALSVDQTMLELGLPVRGEAAVREWVGKGIEHLVERALSNGGERTVEAVEIEHALDGFMRNYAANNGLRSRAYPGAEDLLGALRAGGRRLACVTNKAAAFTMPLLEKLDLARYFHDVLSGDEVARKKPHPDALQQACTLAGLAPREALFVGDSSNDVQAARACGMPVVCATYGYNHGEPIAAAGPDALFGHLGEVAGLLAPPCAF
jgi:phosphoglycolate phosphatase